MKKKSNQILIINSLRGLAALVFCSYHFVCITIGYIESEIILEVFHFGGKGVQIFFIISGISIFTAHVFWKLVEKPSQLKSQKIKIKGVNKT